MNFNQLKYILEVYRTRSFTQAASNLFIAQPSLSQQIKSLEEELNIEIFNRKKRKRIEITPAGKRVIEYATEVETNLGYLKRDLSNIMDNHVAELRVGLLWTFGYNRLNDFLKAFRKIYPKVNFLYQIDGSKNLIAELQNGNLDMAFITEDSTHTTNYGKQVNLDLISTSHLNVVINQNHALASKDFISLEDLHEENILMVSEKSFLYDELIAGFKENRVVPNIIGNSSQADIIIQIAKDNIGFGFLAEESFINYTGSKKEVCSIPLKPSYNRNIYLITNKTSYQIEWVEKFRGFIINLANLDILENLENT